MSSFLYLVQVNVCLLLFYVFYRVFLQNETFFRLNRIYLVASVVLSFLIPFLQSETIRQLFVSENVVQVSEQIKGIAVLPSYILLGKTNAADVPTAADALTLIYIIGCAIALMRLIWQLRMAFLPAAANNNAYSFFNRIVVAEGLANRDAIYKHERVHAVQWHSADVMLFEFLTIVTWFNPVIYAYKKAVRSIHEFIADEETAKSQPSKEAYARLLVSNLFGVSANQLTNGFNKPSLLKRRIMMLYKSKSRNAAILKYGLSAPLFAMMLIFSSATLAPEKLAAYTDKIVEARLTPFVPMANDHPADLTAITAANETTAAKLAKNASVPLTVADRGGKAAADTTKKPIYVVDGKEVSNKIMSALNPNSIESVRVLKGESAITKYGEKGHNGVVEIALKDSFEATSGNQTFTAKSDSLGRSAKTVIGYKTGEKPITILNGKVTEMSATSIKPGDIASISIVKGAEATSLYGDKAKDGAVVIITKDQAQQQPQTPGNEIFTRVEVLPTYPGGSQAFGKFIGDNYKYPKEAKEKGISGKIYLQFVVEKDGSVNEIKVARDLGYGTGDEAIRVMHLMPKWNPGIQNGKPVRVAYTVPIAISPGTTK